MHIYRVLIVYDIEGWAYHHNAMALQKFAPPDFHVTVSLSYDKLLQNERFDLILFLPFTHVDKLRTACNSMSVPPLIISVFSVGWGYANDWLEEARSHSDGVIISSYRMWDQSGRLPDTWYVPSGADFDIFNVTEPIEARQPRVLWCGSPFHRKIKGYDDILVPLKQKLLSDGIELDLRLVDSTGQTKYSLPEMMEWYNTGSIYLCASLAEGTPNTVLEAAACGCTVVTTPVGNMPELIRNGWNGYLVKWDLESFHQHIVMALNKQTELARNMQETIPDWGWAQGAKGYFDTCRLMLERQNQVDSQH